MPKKVHTEEQIIAALKQYEAGDKPADICGKLGISQATLYIWKRQYAGLGRTGAAITAGRERKAEADRGRPYAGPADPAGDCLKKAVKPRHRRRLARWAQETYRVSERRSARVLGMAVSVLSYPLA